MVALIANILHWLSVTFLRQAIPGQLTHHLKIPLPPIVHKVLDDEFLDKFDEVLIVGDVHGCFDEMLDLLKNAENQVNGGRLLKLFTGDLTNKGPKSREVIQYFLNEGREDSLSVRGNHDEFIINTYLKLRENPDQTTPTTEFIKNFTIEEIDYLISLPYTISLPSLNSVIVHAGLIPGKPLEQNQLRDMVEMRNLIYGDYFDEGGIRATKSDMEGDPWASSWRGPQMVYFGHDAKRRLQKHPFSMGLDTGCVYGGHLTGVFIKRNIGKLIQVPAKLVYSPIKEKTEL